MCVCMWWGVPVIGNEWLSFQQTSICVCTCVDVGLDGWAVLHGWGTYQNGWRAESAWLSHCCNQACPPSVQRTRSSLDLKALNSEVAHCGFWSRFLTFYHEPVLLGFETKPTVLKNWVLVLARFLLAVCCCCCLLCLFVLSTWQNPGYSRKKNWYRGKKKKPASMGWPCRQVHQVFSCLICSWCGRSQSIVNSAAPRKENRLSKPVAAASPHGLCISFCLGLPWWSTFCKRR